MQRCKPTWEEMETAPKDRDFLVRLAYGYITRARFVGLGKALGFDSIGPAGKTDDNTATHWTEVPLFDDE